MQSTNDVIALAVRHHQAGELTAAAESYRRILVAEPNHVDALHLLGVVLHQIDGREEAIDYIRRAIQMNGNEPTFQKNLGNVLKAHRRFDEAIAAYRRAIELKPEDVDAHLFLGNTYRSMGKFDDAVEVYRLAQQRDLNVAEIYNGLGNTLYDQGKWEASIAAFRRALELKPSLYMAENNLGISLKRMGKLDEAVAAFERAVTLNPKFVEAYCNLGNALNDRGDHQEAWSACQRAIELKPDAAGAYNGLAMILHGQKKYNDAVAYFRRALAIQPDYIDALNNLGNTLRGAGRITEAVETFRQALRLKPDHIEAHINLGAVLLMQGELDETIACYQRALELNPNSLEARSNLLFAIQYSPRVTLSELATAHAEYNRRHVIPLRGSIVTHDSSSVRPKGLRVGFVSPDLGRHPVGYFLQRLFENLRVGADVVVCYSDRIAKDDLTHRLQAVVTEWHDVHGATDEQLTQQIRADKIDILFDMAGHTAHNRLLVFARKPAPIQITWMGYMCTTGVETMDFLLADRQGVPIEAEPFFSERILRMPDGHICYAPPEYAPPVTPLPALARGHVTFGCFNNSAKITPPIIEVWSKILQRLPTARLVLKFMGLDDPAMASRFVAAFGKNGIEARQLELQGLSPHNEVLREYQRIDIALDTSPYTGCLTTCEALWMGLPVITCPGETLTSRQSSSCVINSGLTGTIATDLDHYVDLAISWATDLPRLAATRTERRAHMAASPLCDGKRFATNFSALMHDVWNQRMGPSKGL